jgi:hypothetical protein
MVRRVVDWTNKVARGRDERNKHQIKAEFLEGRTIGSARRRACCQTGSQASPLTG